MQTRQVYSRLARCTKFRHRSCGNGHLFHMQPLLLQAVQSPDQPQHRMVMKLGS
ncbi:FAA hydrolase family protein, partial [Xanthomonas oryzae pv. oryzae]